MADLKDFLQVITNSDLCNGQLWEKIAGNHFSIFPIILRISYGGFSILFKCFLRFFFNLYFSYFSYFFFFVPVLVSLDFFSFSTHFLQRFFTLFIIFSLSFSCLYSSFNFLLSISLFRFTYFSLLFHRSLFLLFVRLPLLLSVLFQLSFPSFVTCFCYLFVLLPTLFLFHVFLFLRFISNYVYSLYLFLLLFRRFDFVKW